EYTETGAMEPSGHYGDSAVPSSATRSSPIHQGSRHLPTEETGEPEPRSAQARSSRRTAMGHSMPQAVPSLHPRLNALPADQYEMNIPTFLTRQPAQVAD